MNTVNETPRSKLRGISPRLTSFVISLLRSKLRGIKPSLGLKTSTMQEEHVYCTYVICI